MKQPCCDARSRRAIDLVRNSFTDQKLAVDGAEWLITHMCEHLGIPDLGSVEVLDVGCGVRFSQAIVNRGIPVKHYVGIDTAGPVIDFLQQQVSDPRLEYHHLDAHNELYNPRGRPLAALTVPQLEGRKFDVICLFSVFTHLDPEDYTAMLRLLRRYVKSDGRLFYTLFINEPTEGGYGYVDQMVNAISTSDPNDPQVTAAVGEAIARGHDVPDFQDVVPNHPMRCALYSRRYALDLIDGTGWEVVGLFPPDVHLQHHIVAIPV